MHNDGQEEEVVAGAQLENGRADQIFPQALSLGALAGVPANVGLHGFQPSMGQALAKLFPSSHFLLRLNVSWKAARHHSSCLSLWLSTLQATSSKAPPRAGTFPA